MHLSAVRHAPALALFAFSFAVRAVTSWRLAHSPYGAPVTGDMRFYAEWARRIAEGQLTDFHAFYGQPLYAYLLGGIFSVVGFYPALIGLFQAAADAATAVLIYKIAKLCFDDANGRGAIIGAIATVGWTFFIPSAAYGGLLIPASFTVFTWWFCVWWLLARGRSARLPEWLSVAIFVGLMATMSATVLFVGPLFLAAAIRRSSITRGLAVAAGLAIGTAPAWVHNAAIAHDPVFISAHSGVNFWIGNNPEANGYPRVPRELPSEQAALLAQSIKLAEAAAGRTLPRSAVSQFWSHKARDYIRAEPARWAQLLAVKSRNFWNAFQFDDLSSITAIRDAGIVLPGISFALAAALGLPGLLLAAQRRIAASVISAVLLQMLALLPVFVNERYRLAAAPGLLLLSAYFVVEIWRNIAARQWPAVAVPFVALALSTWFVTLPVTDRALSSLNDYKTARRHILAGQFALGEMRMRRAVEAILGTQQLASPIANGFAEIAREQFDLGDRSGAIATLDAAQRINPADERLRQVRQRLAPDAQK